MIRITRGSIAIGPMMMASGSGGGPKTPTKGPLPIPTPPEPSWWQKIIAWIRKHFP